MENKDLFSAQANEIKLLEEKLEQKKQEYSRLGVEHPERQVFREVIKEHGDSQSVLDKGSEGKALGITTPPGGGEREPDEEAIMNRLVSESFKHGIAHAIKEAKKTGSARLLDMLHDELSDKWYEKLVLAKKIKSF